MKTISKFITINDQHYEYSYAQYESFADLLRACSKELILKEMNKLAEEKARHNRYAKVVQGWSIGELPF